MIRKFSVLTMILMLFVIGGCGSDNGKNPVDNGGSENNGGTAASGAVLNESQHAALEDAQNLFARLSDTMSADNARKALVDSLSSRKDISDVMLWEDGVTVSLRFSDGIFGVVETGGSNSFSGGNAFSGTAFNGNAFRGNTISGNAFGGNAYSGTAFNGNAFGGNAYSGTDFGGTAFGGNAFGGNAFGGNAFVGTAFAGNTFGGNAFGGKASYAAAQPGSTADYAAIAKAAGSRAIPDSGKVLFMVISTDVDGISKHVSDARKVFVDAGWDPLDVEIREPTSIRDYATVNPNTLLSDIQQYGIIFLYAHGKYGRPVFTLLPQHYIQFCYNFEYPNYDLEQLKAWAKEGKVIVSLGSLYMRQDLFAKQVTPFPGSIVVLTCCWGQYTKDSFLKNGARSVFSWDHMVMGDDAYVTNTRIAREMSSASPPVSDTDMFGDPLLVKTSRNTLGETAELYLDHTYDDVYFPAKADVAMNVGVLSFPVSGVRVTVRSNYVEGRTVLFGSSGEGVINGLMPGENRFVIEALDVAGDPAFSLTVSRELHGGVNEVNIDLNVQIVYGQVLKYTYEDGFGGYGPYTTDFIRYWRWKRNPDGNGYVIIFHHDYDDREDFVGSPQTIFESDIGDKKLYEVALRKEQIIGLYVKDIIGIGDDEVVLITYGSHYGSHRGEDTISE